MRIKCNTEILPGREITDLSRNFNGPLLCSGTATPNRKPNDCAPAFEGANRVFDARLVDDMSIAYVRTRQRKKN